MQKFDFSYDPENDDLFIYNPDSRSKGSVEVGDFVLDFDSKKELVGIQVMRASELFKDLVEEEAPALKEFLANLTGCRLDVKAKNNMLIIKFCLSSKAKDICPVISVPSIKEPSPALAYA